MYYYFVTRFLAVLSCVVFISGCSPDTEEVVQKKAPLFDNIGSLHHKVSTTNELAQKYFDQGLTFSYGFNHAEAFRSFNEAARLDTNLAMAYWGMALVLGPNINSPMESSDIQTAYDAIQKAISLIGFAKDPEKDYIYALAKRYAENPPEDRSPLDQAYSDAMKELADKYPDDADANTLYAESLMDLHPWDFWNKDGTAQPWTENILATLQKAIDIDVNHPGANHLFIHAIEASETPERGIPNADRLRNLIPGAGHLVHMPAHIYIRTGRYHDGSTANELAVKSDENYFAGCYAQGLYPLAYYPHNYHFLWATASIEGRSKTAIDAALKTAETVNDTLMMMCGYSTLQHFYVIPYFAYVRFGKWDEILKSKNPGVDLPYAQAVWHYAKGMAYVAKNNLDGADNELRELNLLSSNQKIADLSIWGINHASDLVNIAAEVLAGELVARHNDFNGGITHLQKALDIENKLRYDEPPTWFYPVRHNLGAVLLEAGRFKEAEKIYREDLAEFPDNGWALFGLMQSLYKGGKNNEAAEVEQKFNEAWQFADIVLTSSRIM